jgi:hypothetical protein
MPGQNKQFGGSVIGSQGQAPDILGGEGELAFFFRGLNDVAIIEDGGFWRVVGWGMEQLVGYICRKILPTTCVSYIFEGDATFAAFNIGIQKLSAFSWQVAGKLIHEKVGDEGKGQEGGDDYYGDALFHGNILLRQG